MLADKLLSRAIITPSGQAAVESNHHSKRTSCCRKQSSLQADKLFSKAIITPSGQAVVESNHHSKRTSCCRKQSSIHVFRRFFVALSILF
jgi:hypothetical protein